MLRVNSFVSIVEFIDYKMLYLKKKVDNQDILMVAPTCSNEEESKIE